MITPLERGHLAWGVLEEIEHTGQANQIHTQGSESDIEVSRTRTRCTAAETQPMD